MTGTDDLIKGESGNAVKSDIAGQPGNAIKPYLSFLTLAAAILTVLVVLGILPTRRLAGEEAIVSMVAGCSFGFLAALLGTLPVLLARGQVASGTVPAVMMSILVRTSAVIILGFAAAQSGWFETKPLLIWLVLSHASLQVADIRFTKQVLYTSRS